MATYISDDPKLLDELFGRKTVNTSSLSVMKPARRNPMQNPPICFILPIPTGKTLSIRLYFVQPTIDKSQILRLRTEYPSGNLFIPEDDGCTGYLRRYFQKGIYQSYYYPISGKRDWLL